MALMLEIVGLVMLAAAAALWNHLAGLAVGGGEAVALGVALDMLSVPRRKRDRQ